MRSATIEKIGFFHCIDFGTPVNAIAKLRDAMAEKVHEERERDSTRDIGNSLIVLPEAFNFGNYDGRSALEQSPQFIEALVQLAAAHRVIFVTGILEGKRNSAYLIDGESAQLMCHKIGDDYTGFYDPCTGNPDTYNPITFSNACVGTLIRIDAAADDGRQPHIGHRLDGFLDRLSEPHTGRKIVCVPARFSQHPRKHLDRFSKMTDCWYVVAQGSYTMDQGPSFVADGAHNAGCFGRTDCSHIKVRATDNRNEVRLWQLPQAPAKRNETHDVEGTPLMDFLPDDESF
jgi:predicted amidohydrolase